MKPKSVSKRSLLIAASLLLGPQVFAQTDPLLLFQIPYESFDDFGTFRASVVFVDGDFMYVGSDHRGNLFSFAFDGDFHDAIKTGIGWLDEILPFESGFVGRLLGDWHVYIGGRYASFDSLAIPPELRKNVDEGSIMLLDRAIIFWDEDGHPYSISVSDSVEPLDQLELLNSLSTERMINSGELSDNAGWSMHNGNLFLDGRFYTRSYRQFIRYFMDTGVDFFERKLNAAVPFAPSGMEHYMGQDSDGNTYWSILDVILVFGEDGYVRGKIEYGPRSRYLEPIVNPRGDIVLIGRSDSDLLAFTIPRNW